MSANRTAWVRLLRCDALRPGSMKGLEVPGRRLVVYNVLGAFHVTDNVCTHAFAILSDGWLEGGVVECPLHGGRFDVATGKVLNEPAVRDLRTYPVRIVEGNVEVLLPT
jgi:nitrite reductase/ring-hydroxylating ferredoxin subunit